MTHTDFSGPHWPPGDDEQGRLDPIQGRKLAFVDFEASSLSADSYPIEVAFVSENGWGDGWLIKPMDGWDDWSVSAESVHGIAREMLEREGADVGYVAERMALLLGNPRVIGVSDNPQFDAMWLRELYAAAGIRQAIELVHVRAAYLGACQPLMQAITAKPGTTTWQLQSAAVSRRMTQIITDAVQAEAQRPRTRHRAGPDAESMWRVWRDIKGRVAAALGERG